MTKLDRGNGTNTHRSPDCTFRHSNIGRTARAGHWAKRAAERPPKLLLESHR